MNNQFEVDVEKGLNTVPKFISSKYFYDKIGDELFVEIMNMPEYYLTKSELDIFSQKTSELINMMKLEKSEHFQLIELGAGDGLKTKKLLHELVSQDYQFEYLPIDISPHTLNKLKNSLAKEIVELKVLPQQGDYFEVLSSLKNDKIRKIVLFLGSNIGNLKDELSAKFLKQLGNNLAQNDQLLLGVDLIKSIEIVLPAYNDTQGITARFNLNLLTRINRELGANFNLSQFSHLAEYEQEEGIAKSYLVSNIEQSVYIKALNQTIEFAAGEKIHTEISRKYNETILKEITKNSDFEITNKILDSKEYFANYLLKKI